MYLIAIVCRILCVYIFKLQYSGYKIKHHTSKSKKYGNVISKSCRNSIGRGIPFLPWKESENPGTVFSFRRLLSFRLIFFQIAFPLKIEASISIARLSTNISNSNCNFISKAPDVFSGLLLLWSDPISPSPHASLALPVLVRRLGISLPSSVPFATAKVQSNLACALPAPPTLFA